MLNVPRVLATLVTFSPIMPNELARLALGAAPIAIKIGAATPSKNFAMLRTYDDDDDELGEAEILG